MPSLMFFSNLQKSTFEGRLAGYQDPEGYLLSAHRLRPQLIDFALILNDEHEKLIMADNGFFLHISGTIEEFLSESLSLREKVLRIEADLHHCVTPTEVPSDIRNQYRDLVEKILKHISAIERDNDYAAVLEQQQRIKPHYFITREDILGAVLIGLSIEPEYVKKKSSFYSYRNVRAARFYNHTVNRKYGDYTGKPYAVISCVDYNTGRRAGVIMARNNAKNLALGVGGYMLDSNFVDYYIKGRRMHRLDNAVPRRYLRIPLVVKGVREGYKSETDQRMNRFHLLGMGSQIMILITSLFSDMTKEMSFDSTSPMKDASGGLIYVNDPAEKKIRATKLARLFCRFPEKQWYCQCKYCSHYKTKYPFDNERAADWYERNGRPNVISVNDLRGETELAKCFTMFSEPSNTELRQDIAAWRVGHNHLILESLFDKINRQRSRNSLERLVSEEVNKYAEHTSLVFGNSVKVALSIALE